MEARHEYEQRLKLARQRVQQLAAQLSQLIWVRTGLFFASTFFLALGYTGDVWRSVNGPLGWLLFFAFVIAIVWNEHKRLAHLSACNDVDLFERLIARLDRQWAKLPTVNFLTEVPQLTCTEDLDVAGENSLLALLNLTGTHPGSVRLQSWIAVTPSWQEVEVRQAATRAMIPARELRLELIRRVSNTSFATKSPYGLAEWAKQSSWLKAHPFAQLLSYICPALLIVGAAVLYWGYQQDDQWWMRVGLGGLTAGAIANILITVFWGSWIHDIFHRVAGEHHASRQFAEIFELLEQLPEDNGILTEARHIATQSSDSATRGFVELNRIVKLATLQRNVIFYLVYLALQQIFLWDFRILLLLERWQSRYGKAVESWFEALGRVEAVISSATLADEHPDWCYPQPLEATDLRFRAQQLGHPLLPTRTRVNNDLTLEANRPLLLVTGSNMAGKSTFMRALGVNLLLARTGCKVCAQTFESPMYEIASSIRVTDSLREGVSFFMAELKRLKSVVDQAVKHRDKNLPPLLFLLDEILQGTNSRERQIAVAHVVGQLVKFGSTGLLSTHDLDLAKVDAVSAVAQIVHFREYFETDSNGEQKMRFDYIMRPGPTPTTNALKLLEMVGLK